MLDRGETLSTVAQSVGYADQSHFTHRFKRHVGVTPGQYVRNTLSPGDDPEEIL
jgi:AraC-like DNA-binding protein